MYGITKLRLLKGCVDYTVKNNPIRHLGTISDLYTPSDHQIYLLIISLHLKIDCGSIYGHFVYDITKLRLSQGCVDYTVKNDLDSSSRHHFWPIFTFRSSNLFIDHFIASKNWLVSVYGPLVYGITKLRLLKGCVDYTVKNNPIRHLGTISDLYTPSDHQIYLLIISIHLKIDWLASMGL